MKQLKDYIANFFDMLEVYEDIERGHCYKIYIRQAIYDFLDNESKEKAFAVYRAFFDSYRITLRGSRNPFMDLLDVLKNYEENAAVLIDKQRDHYIHSTNVFILGLCIYAENARYRLAFAGSIMDKTEYPYSYDTKNEEFFYRWGIASLFHDVGYPVEIIGSQITKFMDFVTDVDGKSEIVNAHLAIGNYEALNRIPEIIPKREFTASYFSHYEDSVYIDTLKPVDLLAHKLHIAFSIGLKDIKAALNDFVNIMARFGFIDHGFFSSIIILKWYGYLIQCANYKPEYFFWPVLDSASAILLHNYYRNVLMKKPFDLKPLQVETHPIGFMLILCDELQEWNRQPYGIQNRQKAFAAEAKIEISSDKLAVTFITHNGSLPDEFSREKKKLLQSVIGLGSVFTNFSIHCRLVKKPCLPIPTQEIIVRPALEELEKLAKEIHKLYNEKQLERSPDKTLKHIDFDSLTDLLKYSNLRQAMDIPEKLRRMGFTMRPIGSEGEIIEIIPEEYIEILAEEEHESWMAERIASGWMKGEQTDADKKITPYLMPYSKLPQNIKQLDRDSVMNIPVLLEKIGMAVYKN